MSTTLPHRLADAAHRRLFVLIAILLLSISLGPVQSSAEPDRLRILLLDYNASIENDVLLSHLCVTRCTPSLGCPDELVRDGVDYWNEHLAVYRPAYLGRSARFVVNAYKNKQIDLLSISGHHASGFSGDFGRGSFHTTELAAQLDGLPGREGFFTTPSIVMLQGCWTDVKSGFEGDPIEYVRHIVEDTAVRAGESDRLLAAIEQIAGEDEAYRELFPNACILGYKGTQIPGGLAEIYGQVDNFLRGVDEMMTDRPRAAKHSLIQARRSRASLEQMVRDVDRECGSIGWPCNLCRQDESYYKPLAASLVAALDVERQRLRRGETRTASDAARLERQLEDSSLYTNVRWSCSKVPTSTPPVFPEPLDRSPYLELFVELLMIDLGNIAGDTRHRIESELVHLLGSTEVEPVARERLRARQESPEGAAWRRAFTGRTLRRLSTFRQRDFYDFLSSIGCAPCFVEALSPESPRQLRENAASQLRPRLGRDIYRLALQDPSARVRLLAASRLRSSLGDDLIELAREDADPRVGEAANKALVAAEPAVSTTD